jgi:predicted KAP-like P-loop ATPase
VPFLHPAIAALNHQKNMDNKKPFSQQYVLATTVKHVKRSIETSIRKTMDRMNEFEGDHLKSNEIFKTLTILQAMKKQVDSFNSTYKDS